MHDVQMSLQLVLCLERDITLLTTPVVWTLEVRALEVDFQRLITIVEHVSVVLTVAQVTRQMHAIQMLLEQVGVEEELLAEVTPWVRQDFCASLRCCITVLNVIAQLLHVIDALLTDKYCAALDADQTEGLLMSGLHVTTQTLLVRKCLLRVAVVDEAS